MGSRTIDISWEHCIMGKDNMAEPIHCLPTKDIHQLCLTSQTHTNTSLTMCRKGHRSASSMYVPFGCWAAILLASSGLSPPAGLATASTTHLQVGEPYCWESQPDFRNHFEMTSRRQAFESEQSALIISRVPSDSRNASPIGFHLAATSVVVDWMSYKFCSPVKTRT